MGRLEQLGLWGDPTELRVTPDSEGDWRSATYDHPAPRAELLWAYVDLDGTLAEPIWTAANPTSEIGAPIKYNVFKLKRDVVARGLKVVIHTSRPWTDYEAIERWLIHNDIPFKTIQCGKPLGIVYIDDRALSSFDESWTPKEFRGARSEG